MLNINVCTDGELFEVKVPLKFLGTEGFSLRREGRYKFRFALYQYRFIAYVPEALVQAWILSHPEARLNRIEPRKPPECCR